MDSTTSTSGSHTLSSTEMSAPPMSSSSLLEPTAGMPRFRIMARLTPFNKLAVTAPKARFPDDHTPKMDVCNFGVLLFKMCLQEQPEVSVAGRAEQAKMVQLGSLAQIIREYIAHLPKDRPTIAWVLEKLKLIPV